MSGIPEPLGHNQGRYVGETIDIDALRRATLIEAERHGWSTSSFYSTEDRALDLFYRVPVRPRVRIYLSAGIHGDEPAGPRAVWELLQANQWPDDAEVWLVPCLNPTGFRRNTRENAEGIDLNRDYRHLRAPETRAHVDLLNRLPQFDLTLCLHEDWEARGFYLYELNPDQRPSPAEEMIRRVSGVCPVDLSDVIDERPAERGMIRPALDPALRDEWPEALYLIQHKTRWSYTLEAPSDFALDVRVKALTTAVDHVLGLF